MKKAKVSLPLILAMSVLAPVSGLAQGTDAVKEKLVTALTSASKGVCDRDVMSVVLHAACEQQSEVNQQLLAPLGDVTNAVYLGDQMVGNGITAEAYTVEFERGSMLWVASLDESGKLFVLWSNGTVEPR